MCCSTIVMGKLCQRFPQSLQQRPLKIPDCPNWEDYWVTTASKQTSSMLYLPMHIYAPLTTSFNPSTKTEESNETPMDCCDSGTESIGPTDFCQITSPLGIAVPLKNRCVRALPRSKVHHFYSKYGFVWTFSAPPEISCLIGHRWVQSPIEQATPCARWSSCKLRGLLNRGAVHQRFHHTSQRHWGWADALFVH